MNASISLSALIRQYRTALETRYATQLLPSHRKALDAIVRCRTQASGQSQLYCPDCDKHHWIAHACGHRSCPLCQNHLATAWLERQSRKLLPVEYFMVTFTVPRQLRRLLWRHQRAGYNALMQIATQALLTFARNAGARGGAAGMTAVLHTHNRRLDHHPHVHVIVPAGYIQSDKKRWVAAKTKYLFNHENLASVFRAKLLEALRALKLTIPDELPTDWVVDCRHVGGGAPALKYLSRYLYRGVLAPKNIVSNCDSQVTFRYTEADTKAVKTRTLAGADFLWLLLQHVLPRRFQRVRSYGYLHHSAKSLLATVQIRLKVQLPANVPVTRARPICHHCGAELRLTQVHHAPSGNTNHQANAPP